MDPATLPETSSASAPAPRAPTLALLATLLGNAAAAVTYSAVPVALTGLAADLGIVSVEEIWIPDSFLLAVVCLTPLTSWLIGALGTRRLLGIAFAGLVLSSAATALASSLTALIPLLFLQGLFAAPIPPATQALVAVAVPPSRRSAAMGLWSAGTMLGVLIGAVLGGVVTQHLGWRWIFALGVPLALAALPAVRAALRSGTDAAMAPRAGAGAAHAEAARGAASTTDWRGMLLLVTSLLAAGVAIDMVAEFDRKWLPAIGALAGVTLLSGVAFALHYRRTTRPILDLSTLLDRNLSIAATMNFVVAGSSTGIFETVMLASVLGFTPELIGTINAFRGAALLVGIGLGVVVAGRGHHLRGAISGLVVLCTGKLGYTLWGLNTTMFAAVWPGVVSSVGFGMLSTTMAVMAFATLGRRRSAAAASVFVFSGVVGSALGIAALDAYRAWHDIGGATTGAGALSSYTAVFWMELLATVVLLPLPVLGSRAGKNGESG